MSYTRKPQNPNSIIVFDFETGGTDPRINPVTEIALISLDGATLNTISDYHDLIGQYDENLVYEDKALKYTNITMELLEEQGNGIREVAERVLAEFEKANIRQEKSPGLKPILCGHNVAFDSGFLHHLMFHGLKDTKLNYQEELKRVLHGNADFYGNFQPTCLDTWTLAKTFFQGEGEMMDYKLGSVVEKLGIDINNAHRAMNDVVSTTEVVRGMINSLSNGFANSSQSTKREFKFPI